MSTLHPDSTPASGSLPGRAPAPGEAAERSPETERAYLARALWFESHAATHLGISEPSPLEVAAYAMERRAEWSKSTWRQTKAALLFRYGAMGTRISAEAADMLRGGTQTECVNGSQQTSGRRAKSVTPEALREVLGLIRGSRSRYAALLETWLILGTEIGLRPHEWCQAEVVRVRPVDVGDDFLADDPAADPDAAVPYLRIENGKATNGRSHGQYRHLNLAKLSPQLIETVAEFSSTMTDIHAAGHYTACYSACQRLLARINASLHGDSPRKWVQLYSSRHKFSSEAKKHFDTDAVAALMGHATNKTATEHYGRRVSSTGSIGPRPIAAEVARVRQVRHAKARRAGSGTAPQNPRGGTDAGQAAGD